jgi:Fe-S-cluster-containing dehydrogenase component/formate-dependent nitrite reductase membrane component NrfD
MNFGFVIDNRNCIGCHACTVACKSEHDVPVGVNRTWVKYVEKGVFPNTRRLFSVMRCNHCENAPCVEICPTRALYTREDGIVDFDNRRCIACKACTQACPYDAIYIDPQSHTAAKCNYCAHRVEMNLEPACVNVCPTQAIISGNLDDPNSRISQLVSRQQVTVRKPEKGTRPKLFYVEGDESSLTPGMAGQDNRYLWSSQVRGVGHHAAERDDEQERFAKVLGEASEALDSIRNYIQTENQPATRASGAKRVYDAPAKGVMWGWEVAAYILTKAVAAGMVMVPFLAYLFGESTDSTPLGLAAWVALLFLGATGVLLIKDLDQPTRFLYVLFRPNWSSWLVKGAYIITAYGGLLTLWILLDWIGASWLANAIGLLLTGLGALTALYTGFLFNQAKGRDLWQSPLMPVHMLIHALIAGPAVWLVLAQLSDSMDTLSGPMSYTLLFGLLAQLLILAAEVWSHHPTEDSHRAVHLIAHGPYRQTFWRYGVGLGSVLPLLLLVASFEPLVLVLAAGLSLFGLWHLVRLWVQVPQLIPLS